jgi:hypothetical protein
MMADLSSIKTNSWKCWEKMSIHIDREQKPGYKYGRVGEKFILENLSDFNRHSYVCGPGYHGS